MTLYLWKKNGALIKNSNGALVKCESCPCEPTPEPGNLYVTASAHCGEKNPNETLNPLITVTVGSSNTLNGEYIEDKQPGGIVFPYSEISCTALKGITPGKSYTITVIWSGLSSSASLNYILIRLNQNSCTGPQVSIPSSLFYSYYEEYEYIQRSGKVSHTYTFNQDTSGNWSLKE